MKSIKAILWDFDGTLIDSTRESMENMILTTKQLKFKVPTIKLLQKYWGIPFSKFVEKIAEECAWKEGSVDLFVSKCQENREQWRSHRFFEGTKEALEILISQELKIGIISTRIKESGSGDLFSIMDYLRILNVNLSMFFFIQGREDCQHIKPNPMVFDSVLAILKEQGIDLSEVIYVGDTLYDFRAAKDYVPSLSFVAITSGACDKVDFLQAGVPEECIINYPKEIFKVVDFLEG